MSINYEDYEDRFDPMNNDRQARRKRKPKANHKPKKEHEEIIEEIADTTGLEGGFQTTYKPSLYEEEWLLSSLRGFYEQYLITDVLMQVKGGKEASVYRCAAHESTGKEAIAAKVYRPRKFRNLRNDKLYRQGRTVLTSAGQEVTARDDRVIRAMGKKTAFGQQVAHTSWLMHEFTTLERLYQAGAAVPQPIASGENAILMDYVGGERMAAPTLNSIRLEPIEAADLFQEVMRNIELMLEHGMIHGDLSAYNILYWAGEITLIDFPQVVNPAENDQARFILARDIERVCEYFTAQGVQCDHDAITEDLWSRCEGDSLEQFQRDEIYLNLEEDDFE